MKSNRRLQLLNLFGKQMTPLDLLRHLGDMSQLAGVQPIELVDGSARGVRAVNLYNAAGLEMQVVPDRGMSITRLSYRGIPLPFISAVGTSHPAFAEPRGLGWLRTWPAGFLTPCGLTQVGSPCQDGTEELGLHGRVAQIPAQQVSWGAEWRAEQYVIWVEGQVRETAVFGENLLLHRRIWMRLDNPAFYVEDRVENQGFTPVPHMFLQHINLGFPLIDETARLVLPAHTTQPRDEAARLGLESCCEFSAPIPGYMEQVFYHDLKPNDEGQVKVNLENPAFDQGRGLGVMLRYAKADYPIFVEWKMMGEGLYVVGLEPANCHVGGRCKEREMGTLPMLAPQEKRTYRLEVALL
jgi:hypothetical protein